jgi:cell division septation protein DedD
MKKNETGEFELVVGNTQLLSGFFIVVLLFAVAFAMGYVVGQNVPRSAKVAADTGSASPVTSAQDTRPLPASPVPHPPPPAADPATQPAADGQPQPSTQPARDPNAPPAASATAPAPAAASEPASTRLVPGADLPPGSFWQLMAIRQPEAEAMRQTLKDKGFPAVLSPGPNNLTRVLVGPFNDTQSFGRAKTDLENAGFQPPVRYRRD